MVSSKKLISLVLIGCLCFSVMFLIMPQKARAYGMDVVFKDTGFGFLIGTGMAALIMAANPNTQSEDWGRGMAVGGVAGAGIGLAIGMTSTYKTALLNLDHDKGLVFKTPTLNPGVLTGKASLGVFKYSF